MDEREREKKGEGGGVGLIPLCISLQPANLHLSAVAPRVGRVLLRCCGMWISVGGGFSMHCRGESDWSTAESGLGLNRIMVSLSPCQAKDLLKEKKKSTKIYLGMKFKSFAC